MVATFGIERRFELCGGRAVLVANIDQRGPDDRDHVLVGIVVLRLDQHLVLHAAGVWQPGHLADVVARDARRRANRHGRRGARRDVRRFTLEQLGDAFARSLQQILHLDVVALRVGHRLAHSRRRRRPSQHRVVAPRVDDGLDPELLIDAGAA